MFKLQYYTFLLTVLFCVNLSFSQEKEDKIRYKADVGERILKDGERVQKLTHHVVFKQENTTVYCDSSYFYKTTNVMEAFGHIKIVDDSTIITSDFLIYNGDTRIAKLRENVIYQNGEKKLYTNFLDYDLDNKIAHYFNNGRLVDATNTLKSKIGYFYSEEDYALFWKAVFLDAPDFDLEADTLRYNTETKVAYTFGPTTIIKKDSTILHAQQGEFRTEIDQSEFASGQIETKEYYMEGDDLFFDDISKFYKAIGHVILTSKEDSIIIVGDEGFYNKELGISKIYGGRPVMKKPINNDTLYLSADTLVAMESDYDSLKRILAYHDVKLYKKGLTGIADSMAYFKNDSLLMFFNDPVMWNAKSQSEGDTIVLTLKNEKLDKMFVKTNAFMTSEDTLLNYNQIKGRNMISSFIDNKIDHLNVNGNGEMLYYSLEEGDSVLMGMNKIFCSHMRIEFEDNELVRFKVYVNPDANFIPPHELTDEIQRLDGFKWRIAEKPSLFDVAHYLDTTRTIEVPELLKYDSIPPVQINRELNFKEEKTSTSPLKKMDKSSTPAFNRESKPVSTIKKGNVVKDVKKVKNNEQ
ncbi:MAG: lipopolysaccharide export system protein LptA [Cyclobacteriaceae bacterium]|jgi:lipopolysaccharide export system protein LptA